MSIKNIVIEQYNGNSFDEIYPQTSVEQVQGFTEAVYALGADATYKVGDILSSVKTDLGNKWLLCNGQIIDAEEYPELYELSKKNNKYLNIDMGIYSGGNSAINCEYVNGQYFITNAEINPANNKELGIKIVYGDGVTFSNPKVIYYNVAGSDSNSNATYQSINIKYGNGQYAFLVRTQNNYYGVYYTSNLEQDWTYKDCYIALSNYAQCNGSTLQYVNNRWFLICQNSSGGDSGTKYAYYWTGTSINNLSLTSAFTRSYSETCYMGEILYVQGYYVTIYTVAYDYSSSNTKYIIYSSNGTTWTKMKSSNGEGGTYEWNWSGSLSLKEIGDYLYIIQYYDNSFNMTFLSSPTSLYSSGKIIGSSYSGNRYYEVGDYICIPYSYSSNKDVRYRKKTDTSDWKYFYPLTNQDSGMYTDIIYHDNKYYIGCIDGNKAYIKYTTSLESSLSSSQIYNENAQNISLCAKGNKLIAYFQSQSPPNGYITYSENGTTWSTPKQVYSGYMSPIGFEASMEDVVMLKYQENSAKLMMYAKSDNLNVWTKKSYQPTIVWPEGYYYYVSTGSGYYNYYGDDVENPILYYDGGSSPLSKVQELFYYKQANGIVSISKNEILGAPAVPEIALDGCYTYIKSKE